MGGVDEICSVCNLKSLLTFRMDGACSQCFSLYPIIPPLLPPSIFPSSTALLTPDS